MSHSTQSDERTLIIAEDHPIFRKGLVEVIASQPRNRILEEVADGVSLVQSVLKWRPKIAVVDVDLPKMNGFDAARKLQEQSLPTALIFLTMHKGEDVFNEAMDLGAQAFVIKDSALEGILTAIDMAAANRHYVSPEISEYLFTRASKGQATQQLLANLTPAELRVLKLISEFKTSKEIAALLGLSVRTIENHRANLSGKLGLQGAQSLAKFAYQNRFWI